jgi:hypothetical protein
VKTNISIQVWGKRTVLSEGKLVLLILAGQDSPKLTSKE